MIMNFSSVEAGYTPISVPGLLTKSVNEAANLSAMRVRDPHSNDERVWTWFQYQEEVKNIAKAFIKLGLDRFESVCILGFNAPEWAIASLAAIHAGGLSVGVYPTNGKEACKYILENSKCSILVVEDQKQLDKVWELRNEISSLNKIIQYSGTPSHPGVLSWKVRINYSIFSNS
ncbi:very long-chain-fatty-acid--CoA ligase bubblegum [Eurytemora carolleeae]|uniref:very long-chain-fatty-acid--CoA ligase bubblegum n=1 Tax=Eurytemora carolleeae TaxID=1294199 RepID=UPI000C78613D|nr:very long-chain-fatty-acid--CoA ligase bubblegum [Eurytemora carolleeae]|eukprot:XP_023332045.1 very long-chain-fatty-acid--CoA ligase bubblegum-like [Eurytemora affinis]